MTNQAVAGVGIPTPVLGSFSDFTGVGVPTPATTSNVKPWSWGV